MTDAFQLHRGTTPLLLSLPHVGTELPRELQPRYVPRALAVEDTDWHLHQLYDFALGLGASVLTPRYSRYLIDLNRPPDNAPMYPGANNTELCPTRFFTGDPLYREGQTPDALEINRRRERYWQPYHDAIAVELQRLKSLHGYALLFDGHSIRSELPWLFPGRLPDLSLGTASGQSCAPSIRESILDTFAKQKSYSFVCDDRFKGGYITRHYGRPANDIHAVQLEMCQCLYMEEVQPFRYENELAWKITPLLNKVFRTLLKWRPDA